MFKRVSDKTHDISRTGSHATKPFGSGRVEVLPPDAAPWETVYNSLREQRDGALAACEAAHQDIAEVNERLLVRPPFPEFNRLKRRREELIAKLGRLQIGLRELRDDTLKMHAAVIGECFMIAAKRMLTDDQYTCIVSSAREAQDEASTLVFAENAAAVIDSAAEKTPEEKREQRRKNRDVRYALTMGDPKHPRHARLVAKQKQYGRAATSGEPEPRTYVDALRLRVQPK